MKKKFKVLSLLFICLVFNSCTYISTVSFSEDENSATLKSNVKASVKINVKEQTAEINQIGISPLEKLKALMPQRIDMGK